MAPLTFSDAYVVMLTFIHLLTRRHFAVTFEWVRLTQLMLVVGGFAVVGNLLLPTEGGLGLVSRLLVCAAIGPALLATGFVHAAEVRQARAMLERIMAGRRAQPGA